MKQEQIIKLLEALHAHLQLRAEVMESEITSANSNEFDMEFDRGMIDGLRYSADELKDIINSVYAAALKI